MQVGGHHVKGVQIPFELRVPFALSNPFCQDKRVAVGPGQFSYKLCNMVNPPVRAKMLGGKTAELLPEDHGGLKFRVPWMMSVSGVARYLEILALPCDQWKCRTLGIQPMANGEFMAQGCMDAAEIASKVKPDSTPAPSVAILLSRSVEQIIGELISKESCIYGKQGDPTKASIPGDEHKEGVAAVDDGSGASSEDSMDSEAYEFGSDGQESGHEDDDEIDQALAPAIPPVAPVLAAMLLPPLLPPPLPPPLSPPAADVVSLRSMRSSRASSLSRAGKNERLKFMFGHHPISECWPNGEYSGLMTVCGVHASHNPKFGACIGSLSFIHGAHDEERCLLMIKKWLASGYCIAAIGNSEVHMAWRNKPGTMDRALTSDELAAVRASGKFTDAEVAELER